MNEMRLGNERSTQDRIQEEPPDLNIFEPLEVTVDKKQAVKKNNKVIPIREKGDLSMGRKAVSESEILRMINLHNQRYTYKQIAGFLGLHINTVQRYLGAIKKRLKEVNDNE